MPGDVSFKVITADTCDVYGRTIVRVKELLARVASGR